MKVWKVALGVALGLFLFMMACAAIIGGVADQANDEFESSSTATVPDPPSADTADTAPSAPAASPSGPKTTFGPGQYRVGTDIAPGTYIAPGGSLCYWERQSTFGGSSPDSIIANNLSSEGQVLVTIAATDKGFKTSGCGTWKPG